jgi:hypothetical protein
VDRNSRSSGPPKPGVASARENRVGTKSGTGDAANVVIRSLTAKEPAAMDNVPTKRCTKCGETKTLDAFSRDASKRDGRLPSCKDCKREAARRQYAANPEPVRERARRWREANPEAAREGWRRWAETHHEELLEYSRRWHAANSELVAEQCLGHYSVTSPPSCACCGSTEHLEIDHVHGGGSAHRRQLFGGRGAAGDRFYRWLIAQSFPPGFQVLCQPCNASKRDGDHCRLVHAGTRGTAEG